MDQTLTQRRRPNNSSRTFSNSKLRTPRLLKIRKLPRETMSQRLKKRSLIKTKSNKSISNYAERKNRSPSNMTCVWNKYSKISNCSTRSTLISAIILFQ